MKYLLALDQGTTSSRAILFDAQGDVAGIAQKEFEQLYPESGWVEHDPWELWNTQRSVAEQVLNMVGLSASDVAAVGVTNQRETTLLWNRRTGEPVHNAIVWQDRRTAGYCHVLHRQGAETMVRERTGLVIDPYFSASKIRWVLDHVPEATRLLKRGELAFGTVDTWLLWNLTHGKAHRTDATNASRTLLYNLEKGNWDADLLRLFDIPIDILPEICDSSGHFGDIEEDFLKGVPVMALAGDQHAALFGQCCFERGMAKNTYGTGCFILMNTGKEPFASRHKLLSTVAWQLKGEREYALEGSVFIGGAVVQWLRDGLGLIDSASEIEALASEVDNAGGLYLVPAFAGLGAPHWDASARGVLIGITRASSRAHLARAALESIAFQSAEVLETMRADSGIELTELRVDGGAAENNLLMQFQADVMGVPVVRPDTTETTALGAAGLAGLAAGFWSSREELAAHWTVNRRFVPRRATEEIEVMRSGWKRALERAKYWEQ